MRTSSVRNIFIFFLFFLPLQYALVGVIGSCKSEPWPAFVFPGFKSVYTYEDGFELSNAVFEIHFENGNIETFNPQSFFPEVPTSQISGVMRTHFSSRDNTKALSSGGREWLINHAADIAGNPVSDIHIVWQKKYFSKPRIQAIPDSTEETDRFLLLNRGEAK